MKITYNWLKEYVPFDWDWRQLLERLTMAGLEEEGVEDLGQRLDGVVVGHVLECGRHPNADRLSVCQVDVGDEVHTVVCGAPNVAAGQKVAVILPGSSLPDGTKIRRAKIRGVESSGMICSEVELDIGTDGSGILVLPEDAPIGVPFATSAGLDDVVMDFEVTPNRPDCLSLLGFAREVRALTGAEISMPPSQVEEGGVAAAESIAIAIDDPKGCSRYVGRVIRGVSVGPSPAWLQNRLRAVGLRPINNVVDITNLVMMELGQPLHAFDLDRLQDARLVVRRARPGETLETLDGTACTLAPEDLVIADGQVPVALAGVMGGSNSEVGAQTRDIVLESAHFSPAGIRQTRTRLGFHTEASARFERGADPEMPLRASDRAARLIAELAGGEVAPGQIDCYPEPATCTPIEARVERINRLLATSLSTEEIVRILELLGCQVKSEGTALTVSPPTYRPDLEREVDLCEEVGRIYGYDRIEPSAALQGPLGARQDDAGQVQNLVRRRLAGMGFDEAVTNTVVEEKWLQWVGAEEGALRLTRPPTESQNKLRSSLIPSLLDVARRNFNQGAERVALFEIGRCFAAGEQLHLVGLWGGEVSVSPWQGDRREVDLLDLKGSLEVLFEQFELAFLPQDRPQFRGGRCAAVQLGETPVGHIGEIKPALAANFAIERPLFLFELDFMAISQVWPTGALAFRPLAKFPPVKRDLALIVPEGLAAADAISHIRQTEPKLIEAVELFDLYRSDQIGSGYKSLAFTIRLRSAERTLDDGKADRVIAAILKRLEKHCGARLRE